MIRKSYEIRGGGGILRGVRDDGLIESSGPDPIERPGSRAHRDIFTECVDRELLHPSLRCAENL
jgi:hypothetical protein